MSSKDYNKYGRKIFSSKYLNSHPKFGQFLSYIAPSNKIQLLTNKRNKNLKKEVMEDFGEFHRI